MVYDCIDGVDCEAFGCVDPPFAVRRAAVGARLRTRSAWAVGDSFSLEDGLEFVWAGDGWSPGRPFRLGVDVDTLSRTDGSASGRFRFGTRTASGIDIPFEGVLCETKVVARDEAERVHELPFAIDEINPAVVPPDDLTGSLAGHPFELGHVSLILSDSGADLLLFAEEVTELCQGPIGQGRVPEGETGLIYQSWAGSQPPPDYFRIRMGDSESIRRQGSIAAHYADRPSRALLSASVHWFEEGGTGVTWSKDWAAAVVFDHVQDGEFFIARLYLALLDPGKSFVAGMVRGPICDNRLHVSVP